MDNNFIFIMIGVGILVIVSILFFLHIITKEHEMTEEEYMEKSDRARQMMTMIDPFTGLPYASKDKPKFIEYRDERFSENKKEDEDSGEPK